MSIVYSMVMFGIIALGMGIFVRAFPEKRWENTTADITFLVMAGIVCGIEAWGSRTAFISTLQIVLYGVVNALILKVFYECNLFEAILWQWFMVLQLQF